MGPLLGPLKPTAFLKPMGPLMSMGPGVIVPPAPPLSVALRIVTAFSSTRAHLKPATRVIFLSRDFAVNIKQKNIATDCSLWNLPWTTVILK